ncbi:hypothetical protein CHS0354_032020 [Potamilus streckersoni]|uniref:Polycystic kidney disease protein 1-like 2 n=1 Tax=Potamilus streckersoni TaxID=2493646 RepID=A0AAE0WG76_9BIVA|nr:hypothetical protein CHS0354_032020 [Potamilus streckersoni]
MILNQLAQTQTHTMDALQQTAMAFKVITDKVDEISEESQNTTVSVMQKVAVQYTNMIDESRSDSIGQEITAAGDMLASLGNIILAATIKTAEQIKEKNTQESYEELSGTDLNVGTNVKQTNLYSSLEEPVQTDNQTGQKARQIAHQAFDVADKIIKSLFKKQTPGQTPIVMNTQTMSIIAKREELKKIDATLLGTKLGMFQLPSKESLQLENNTGSFIDFSVKSFNSNPYVWDISAKFINTPVISLDLFNDTGGKISVQEISEPIEIDVSVDPLTIRVQYVDGDYADNQTMKYHLFRVRSNFSSVNVIIKPTSTNASFVIYVTYGRYPSENDYDLSEVIPKAVPLNFSSIKENMRNRVEDEKKYTVHIPVSFIQQFGTGIYYIGISEYVDNTTNLLDDLSEYFDYMSENMDKSRLPSNYTISFVTSGCFYWNENLEQWKTDGCNISPVSNSYFTRCICNHLTSFGAEFFVPPNTINFKTVFSNLDQKIRDNYAVLTMLCVIIFLYIIGLIYTRHKDRQDIERWGVSPLSDNVTTDQYYYQLTVVTGMRRGAGTKSNVSFVLSGDYADTGVRLLKDEKGHKQLYRGSVNQYIMSVPEPLGPLVYLRVWHDNSGDGKHQGWYLSKIVVTDLQTGEVFVFLCKRWLAVEEEDGMVDRLLPVASHEDLTNFNNIFFSSTKKKLTDSHLWISIFSRPHRSSFTRVQRLSCILSLLMTTMLASAMFFLADERVENAQAFVLGPFKFTLHEGYISIVCSLIVLPVNIAIDQIFRRSVPKRNFVENAFLVEKHVSMLSKFQMNLSLILNSQTKVMAMGTKPTDGEDEFDSDDDGDDFEDEVPSPESPGSLQSARSLSEYPCLDVPVSPHSSSDHLKRSSSVIQNVPQKMQPAFYPGSTKRSTFTSWKTSIEEDEEEEESISLEPGKRSISPYLEVPRFPRAERKRSQSPSMSKKFIFPSLQVPQPRVAQSVLDAKQQFKQLFEKEQRDLPSPSHSDETAFSFSSHHSDDMLIRPNSRAISPMLGMKKKKTRTLPFWCVYIAWFLVFFSSGVSAFLTFLYSMEWGREKSLAWLTSMILSITESVFVIQPFKIILLVIFVAAILKKPEEEEEEEEERDPALLRPKSDEEILVRPPTQALRPSLLIEPPNPEELAKAREKRLNELKMHRILREIFFYMVYLALLILVASHNRDSNSFRTGKAIRNLILSSQYDLQKVNTASGFWQWMNTVLVPSLYLSNLYNGQPAGNTEQRMIGSEVAYRVGPVRLRQQRVQQVECRCPPVMNLFIETCSMDWGFGLDDETTYDENWKPLSPLLDISKIPNYPWKYWSMMDVEGIPYAGQRGLYNGGGYIADLLGEKSNVQNMLAILEKNSWIDRYTRVVFVEFTVYNPNINLFTTVFIVLEMPTTGSFISETRVNTFRLFSYLGGYGVFVILCELSALACVIYFLGREIKSFRQEGRMYFMSFWNCMELSSLCGSLVSVVMYLMRLALTTYTVQKVTKLRVKFHSFQRIAMWDELFGIFLAFTIFLSILKLIHLFRFNRRMSLLATTLQLSAKELSGFSVVFTFFMIAYASWAYVMFGSRMEDFSSMISTFESLLTLVIGGFDFLTLQNINFVFGPIFVFSFILFIVFVLTNMFITIMNESFVIARKDISKQSNEYEIVSFMWTRFKTWTGIDFDKIFRDVRRKYLKESLTNEEELQYNFDDLETKLNNVTQRLETLMETWNQPSPKFPQRNQCRAMTPVSRSETPFFTSLFPTLRMPGFSDA